MLHYLVFFNVFYWCSYRISQYFQHNIVNSCNYTNKTHKTKPNGANCCNCTTKKNTNKTHSPGVLGPASRLQASIGPKIIKNFEIRENPPGPTKIYLDGSASRACQIELQAELRKLVDRDSLTLKLF